MPINTAEAPENTATQRLRQAADGVVNSEIEQLRAGCAEEDTSERFTVEQLDVVVSGLIACKSRAEIAAEAGLTGDRVLDAVAELGTWLTHANGASGVKVVSADKVDRLPLLQVPLAPVGKPRRNKEAKAAWDNEVKRRRRMRKPNLVVIPDGFEPRDCGRDVRQSLGAVVASRPGTTDLVRYIGRKYRESSLELSYELVSVVWFFAHVGRLDEIGEVNPTSRAYHRCVVQAYDLLETARRDAMGSLAHIASGEGDLDQLADAIAKARPLFEAEAARLGRIVEQARRSDGVAPLLAKERRFLAQRIDQQPEAFTVTTIAGLSEGQVRRIAQTASLDTDAGGRAEEAEIRRRLHALGLGNDADMLVPAGMRAIRAELDDVFWDALERRAGGDPQWDHELTEALTEAA